MAFHVPDLDFDKYCDMYKNGEFLLDEMVSHKFGLSDINNGIELMKKGQCLRVLIEMGLV